MRNLSVVIIATLCLAAFPAHAAKPAKSAKPQQAQKERLVLMPLRIPEEDRNLQGAMETALVKGLQQKYEVFSGEQVAQKARQIFMKESQSAKKECDETRCMQGIAEAFQAELIATANVTKQGGNYFLALSIQNIFDNLVVYSESLPCKACDSVQVVEKLKELSGASVPTAPVAAAPAEPEVPKVNLNDPESALWAEVQKGDSKDDYEVYLGSYPKGKYAALAKSRIKKLGEQVTFEAARREQEAWENASRSGSEDNYRSYLKDWPAGKYAGLAQVRIRKLQTDSAVKEQKFYYFFKEHEFWQQVESKKEFGWKAQGDTRSAALVNGVSIPQVEIDKCVQIAVA